MGKLGIVAQILHLGGRGRRIDGSAMKDRFRILGSKVGNELLNR